MQHNVLCFAAVFFLSASLAQTTAPQNQPSVPGQTTAGGTNQQSEIPEQVRSEAEEGIKHLLVSQIDAWNQGNLQGFMAGYWHNPELTFFSGANVNKGWQAALQRYQRTYQGEGKEMGTLEFQDLNIDVLSPQSAVVTGRWQLTMSDGKKPHGLFTLVLKKKQQGWLIVHDHTSSTGENQAGTGGQNPRGKGQPAGR